MSLSEIQREIIEYPGNLVVCANAGTGKTYSMVKKIEWDVSNSNTHKVIAAITFTIKASNEIKNRLNSNLQDHFIGTNNHFALEEIIKPFIHDVWNLNFNEELTVSYENESVKNWEEFKYRIINEGTIYASLKKGRSNVDLIFKLALEIVRNSEACRLYLRSKYFKIYVDEYQDCDRQMNDFFMYLCDELNICLFIVGDDKQSIYVWRGADPNLINKVAKKDNFKRLDLYENYRSRQQIQNYSNLLFKDTTKYYQQCNDHSSILLIQSDPKNWTKKVIPELDLSRNTAILRRNNTNARYMVDEMISEGQEFKYISRPPILDILKDSSWLYNCIARYVFEFSDSLYAVFEKMPEDAGAQDFDEIRIILDEILKCKNTKDDFFISCTKLLNYFGFKEDERDLDKLYQTISNEDYFAAFEPESYQNVSMTIHASKGLEFDQVIIFLDDFGDSDRYRLHNHYVASTRAKNKLIIVKFKKNELLSLLKQTCDSMDLKLADVVTTI